MRLYAVAIFCPRGLLSQVWVSVNRPPVHFTRSRGGHVILDVYPCLALVEARRPARSPVSCRTKGMNSFLRDEPVLMADILDEKAISLRLPTRAF